MTKPKYTLRPAIDQDFPFVRDIYHRLLQDQVEPIWGWDETFQDVQNNNAFKPSQFEIIEIDANPIGILETEVLHQSICMKSISILPDHQNQGIGRDVLESLIRRAEKLGIGVHLRVLKTNTDAQRLYERLGFQRTNETDRHFEMALKNLQ